MRVGRTGRMGVRRLSLRVPRGTAGPRGPGLPPRATLLFHPQRVRGPGPVRVLLAAGLSPRLPGADAWPGRVRGPGGWSPRRPPTPVPWQPLCVQEKGTRRPPAAHSAALPSAPPRGLLAGGEVSAAPAAWAGPAPGIPAPAPRRPPEPPALPCPRPAPRPAPAAAPGSPPAPRPGPGPPRASRWPPAGPRAEPYFGRWRCGRGSPARKGGYSGPGRASS